MKKTTKRLLACILSILLLVTSIPFSALANDADYNTLVSAIQEYEAKMNGTVYKNMKAAYNKYIAAKEVAYAYNYGGNTALDCKTAADELSAATAAMTAWTGVSVDSFPFNYGGAVPSEFSKNVIYATTPGSFGNYDVIVKAAGVTYSSTMYRFLLPKNAVLLYSGNDEESDKDDIILPIMCAYHNAIGAAGNDNAPLGLYINDNSVNETKEDSKDLTLTGIWKGYHETVVSGGPASASAFSWSSAYENNNDKLPGYNKATTEATGKDNRGEKQTTNNGDKWWQYANTMKYTHTEDSFVNGFKSFEFSFTGRTLRFTNVFGGTEADWHLYSKYASGNASWYGTYYVIDYSGVDAALATAASTLNFSGKNYVHGEMNSILNAYETLQDDPSAQGYTEDNIAAKAQNVATTIQNNITSLNSATAPAEQDNGYNALASNIAKSKATYTANNAGGTYTDESFATFKAAYEASQAEAATVAENHFTTATTASALDAAYRGLNKKADPSGKSGDTDYTFNSETGEVTITGPGTMADYESGAESPLGGNSDVKTVVIDPTVTHIGAHAFENDNNLTAITVPASATYGEGAFDGCTKLATVTIVGGAVENESAPNAPWKQPSVKVVKLGENEDDLSVTAIGDDVFADNKNTAFYVYYPLCDFSDVSNNTFGSNPTIYGYVPSTAFDYAEKFHYSFVSLGHEHIFNEGTVVPATCTVSGYTEYKCRFCDYTKTGNYVSALGHDWNDGEIIEPTCTERGYTLYTCKRPGCGETKKSNNKKALGHDYNGEKNPQYSTGQDRSDTTQYKHSIACTRCESTKDEYCSFKVDGTDPATGKIVFKCSVCGGTYLAENTAGTGEHMVFYLGADNEFIGTERVATNGRPTNVPEIKNQKEGHKYFWTLDGVEKDPAQVIINQDTVFKVADSILQYNVTYVDTNGYEIKTESVNYGSTPSDIPELPEAINLNDNGHQVCVWDNDPSTAVITADATFTQQLETKAHDFEDTILSEPTCVDEGARSRYCPTCDYRITNEVIPATGKHEFEETVVAQATCTTGQKIKKVCSICGLEETTEGQPLGHDFSNNAEYCRRGCGTKNANYVDTTPISSLDISGGKKVNETQVDNYITRLPNDNDAAGTKFSFMLGRQKKVAKNAIQLTWKKPANAAYFVVYGNKCGAANKYKKLAKVWSTSFVQKGLAKNTYYKYMIAAFDRNGNLLGTTNTIHAATLGGKNGNPTAVTTKAKKVKIKKGKSAKLGAKIKAPKKQKVKKHRAIRYESTNPAVATVSAKGVVKGKAKGTCYVIAYAQNGVYKSVKVTVK